MQTTLWGAGSLETADCQEPNKDALKSKGFSICLGGEGAEIKKARPNWPGLCKASIVKGLRGRGCLHPVFLEAALAGQAFALLNVRPRAEIARFEQRPMPMGVKVAHLHDISSFRNDLV